MCEDQLVIWDSYFKALEIKKKMNATIKLPCDKKEIKILCATVKFQYPACKIQKSKWDL